MSEKNFKKNKNFISSREASKLTKYTSDYVGQLCREGKVEAKKINRSWYVSKDSLLSYIETEAENKSQKQFINSAESSGNISNVLYAGEIRDVFKNKAISDNFVHKKDVVFRDDESALLPELHKIESWISGTDETDIIETSVLDTNKEIRKYLSSFARKSIGTVISVACFLLIALVSVEGLSISRVSNYVARVGDVALHGVGEFLHEVNGTDSERTFSFGWDVVRDTSERLKALNYAQNYLANAVVSRTLSHITTDEDRNISALVTESLLAQVASPAGFIDSVAHAIYAKINTVTCLFFCTDPYVVVLPDAREEALPQEDSGRVAQTTDSVRIIERVIESSVVNQTPPVSFPSSAGITRQEFENSLASLWDEINSIPRTVGEGGGQSTIIYQDVVPQEFGIGGDKLTLTGVLYVNNDAFFDTDTLVIDSVNNRVGIGTTSPSARFSVGGNMYIDGTITAGNVAVANQSVTDLTVSNIATLGSATSSSITYFNSRIGSSLVPTVNNLIDIGSGIDGLAWRTGYFGTSVAIGGTATSTGTGVTASGAYSIGASTTLALLTGGTERMSITQSGLIGIGTTSPSALFAVEGDSYFGGDLTIEGGFTALGTTTLGSSVTDTLVVNGYVGSDLVPEFSATHALGSPSRYWNDAYIDTLTVNNISAASTSIGGTQSATFTINSDNVTADTEDMSLVFYRGTVVPNSVLSWDSTLDRFGFNQPLFIQNDAASTTIPTLSLQASGTQTADVLDVLSSDGSPLFNVGVNGNVGIGTSSPFARLSVAGGGYIAGGLTTGGLIATSSVQFSGLGKHMLLSTDGSGNVLATSTPHVASINATSTTATSTFPNLSITGAFSFLGSYITDVAVWFNGLFDTQLATKDTGDLTEGSNLYWTNTRFDNRLSATTTLPNITTLANLSTIGTITSGVWNGSTIPVAYGGTGQTSFGQGWLHSDGTTLTSSTSPTVAYLTATSTTATSTFAGGLNVGSGGLVYDHSTGNIGIGTAIPGTALNFANTTDEIRFGLSGYNRIIGGSGFLDFQVNGSTKVMTLTTSGTSLGVSNTALGTPNAPLEAIYRTSSVSNTVKEVSRITNTLSSGVTSQGFGARLGYALRPSGAGDVVAAGLDAVWEDSTIGSTDADFVFNLQRNGSLTEVLRMKGSSGNIGIGTTSPYAKLSVVGETVSEYFTATSTTATSTFAGGALFATGGGNVGIGTDTPDAKLQVSGGDIYLDSGRAIRNASFPTYDYFNFTTGGSTGFNAIGNLSFKWNTDGGGGNEYVNFVAGGTELARIDSLTRNMGIGTTSPYAKLSVVGETVAEYFTATSTTATSTFAGAMTVGTGAETISSSGFTHGAGDLFVSNTLGVEGLIFTDTGLSINGASVINSSRDMLNLGGIIRAGSGNSLLLQTNGSSDTHLAIDTIGNIGIGTTSPYAKLSVVGETVSEYFTATSTTATSTFAGQISVGSGGDYPVATIVGNLLVDTDAGSLEIKKFGSVSAQIVSSGALDILSDSASTLRFGSGSASFVINQSNFLGVGTLAPQNRLDVEGAAAIGSAYSGSITAPSNGLIVEGNVGIGTTSPFAKLAVTNDGSGHSFLVEDTTSPDSSPFVIDASGNVGVGTVSPNEKLHVSGNIALENSYGLKIRRVENDQSLRSIISLDSNDDIQIGDSGTDGIFFSQTSYDDILSIVGGKVGVGTITPRIGFSVGNGYVTSGITSAGSDSLSIAGGGSGADVAQIVWGNNDGSKLHFGTTLSNNFVERLTIVDTGNIGIGTTSPDTELDISGAGDAFVSLESPNGWNSGLRLAKGGIDMWNIYNWGGGSDKLVFEGRGTKHMIIDDGSGNVGLGTTSPLAKLSVKGAGTTTDVNFQTTDSSDSPLFTILDSGNVGVGTVSPETNLHVMSGFLVQKDNAAISAAFTRSGGNSFTIGNSGGAVRLGSTGGYDFYTGNTTGISGFHDGTISMVLTDTGNVGIGNTSPSSKLNVQGEAAAQYFTATSTSATSTLPRLASTGGAFDWLCLTGDDCITSWPIAGSSFGESWSLTTNVFSESALAPTTTQNIAVTGTGTSTFAGGLETWRSVAAPYFHATSTTATSTFAGGLVAGNGSLNVLQNGYVGAGTENPLTKFHIIMSGSAEGTPSLGSGEALRVQRNNVAASTAGIGIIAGSQGTASINFGDNSNASSGIIRYDNLLDDLFITTNASERLRITSVGNVGIGTTTPSAKLDVYGSGINNLFSVTRDTGATLGLSFPSNQPTFTGSGDIVFKDTASEIFRADASTNGLAVGGYTDAPLSGLSVSGDVGIGTTSPFAKLHVSDGFAGVATPYTGTTMVIEDDSTNNLSLLAPDANNTAVVFGNPSQNIQSSVGWVGGSSNYMSLYSRGNIILSPSSNVGIGTTSPYAKLSVVGETVSEYFTATSTTATSTFAGGLNVGSGGLVYDHQTGNVGVGTSTPYAKLSFGGEPGANESLLSFGNPASGLTNGAFISVNVESGQNSDFFNYQLNGGSRFRANASGDLIISGGFTTNSNNGYQIGIKTRLGGLVGLRFNEDLGIAWSGDGNYGTSLDISLSRISSGVLGVGNGTIGDSSGTLIAGNIGIGTTSPYAKLSVAGDVVADYFHATSTTATSTFAGGAVFATGGGNVGIGTMSPSSLLSVGNNDQFTVDTNGNTILRSATIGSAITTGYNQLSLIGGHSSVTPVIVLGRSGQDALFGISSNDKLISDSNGGDFVVRVGSSNAYRVGVTTATWMIVNDGKVGIGTTSPYAKLSVVGETVSEYFTATSTTATSTFAGGLNVGSGGLVYDHQTGNVGIGTDSPTQALEISNGDVLIGNDQARKLYFFNTATYLTASGGRIEFQSNGGSGGKFYIDSNGSALIGATDTSIYRAAAGKLYIGNGTAGDSSGTLIADTIGIGTTSPYAKLSVVGETVAEYFTATSTTATSTFAGGALFATGGGNVGIGTTTATNKLTLQGIMGITNGSYTTTLEQSGTDFNIDLPSETTSDVRIYSPTSNTVLTVQSGNASVARMRFKSAGYGYMYMGAVGDDFTFYESNAQGRLMTITQEGLVGIGTTTPYAKLSVVGETVAEYFTATSTTATSSFAGGATFATGGGKVGIGTSTPTKLLTVSGNVDTTGLGLGESPVGIELANRWASTVPSREATIVFSQYAGVNTSRYAAMSGLVTGSSGEQQVGDIVFSSKTAIGDTALSERMRITSGGNVGIGTTSPYAKLSVVGETVAEYFTATSTTATSSFMGGLNVDSGGFVYDHNTGFVGVGTSAPAEEFTVFNNQDASTVIRVENTHTAGTNQLAVLSAVSSDGNLNMFSAGANYTLSGLVPHLSDSAVVQAGTGLSGGLQLVAQDTSGPIRMYTGGIAAANERVRLTSAGNFGIGTATPAYKLDVYRTGDGAVASFTDTNGVCTINPTSTALSCSSDRTLKKDIESLDQFALLDKVSELNTVSYRWKTEDGSQPIRLGFIAQDVEDIFPEFVTEGPNGKKAVSYGSFTPVLASAIQAIHLDVMATSTMFEGTERLTLLGRVVAYLESVGLKIKDGVIAINNLMTDTIVVGSSEKPTGITLYDEVTGDPYCLSIQNGEPKSTAGECGSTHVTSESNDTNDEQASDNSDTDNISDSENSENGGETETEVETGTGTTTSIVETTETDATDESVPTPTDANTDNTDGVVVDEEGDVTTTAPTNDGEGETTATEDGGNDTVTGTSSEPDASEGGSGESAGSDSADAGTSDASVSDNGSTNAGTSTSSDDGGQATSTE